jgi:hypothetical protein
MVRINQGILMISVLLSSVAAARAMGISSATHPATYESFNHDTGTFVTYQRPGGVSSDVDVKSVDGALQMTNVHAGSFGVDTKMSTFDALKFGDVFFDYKLPAGVKVNFFFHINGNYYGAIFSGPNEVRPGTVLLGKIADVTADNKWHRAHIPLRQWLQGAEPLTSDFKVDEVIIGNWDNTHWLMAGIGGNAPGAAWQLDNWTLAASGPEQAEFALTEDDGKPLAAPQKYFWSLDGGPASALTSATLSLGVRSGFHLLQISDTDHRIIKEYGFYAAADNPQIAPPVLHNNEITFPITSFAGVNSSKIALQIDGKNYDFKNPALHWNTDATALIFDAADAGLSWKNNQSIAVQLSGVEDFLSRAAPPLKSTFTVDYKKFTAVPPLPTLANTQDMGSGSFETSLDDWKSDGRNGAILERDTSAAASGYASLKLTCPANAAPFTAWVRQLPFDASAFPYLEFDYRVPPQLRVDLLVNVNGQDYSIGFTDRTPSFPRLGTIDGVKADLQWHHASVPLLQMLQKVLPTADKYEINSVAFGDTGWLGNAQGFVYWLDNFQFVPAVNGNDFTANVQLRDITGVGALAWKLSASDNTDVPRTADNPGSALTLKGNGMQWLGVRAQDGAGNWSPAAQIPLALDAEAPVLSSSDIAPESKAAPAQIAWPLRDNLALNLKSLQLTALGHQYAISDQALTYDAKNDKLIWDLLQALREGNLQPLKNGQTVDWELAPVSDAAGNKSTPLKSTFTYDYALQKSLPEITLNSSTHPRLLFDDFNDGRMPWAALREAAATLVLRGDSKTDRTVEITDVSGSDRFNVRLFSNQWDPQKYNLLSFDYNIPAGANLSLRMRVGNRNMLIKICGEDAKGKSEIPGIVADGKWHTAILNLLTLPERWKTDKISSVDLVDPSGKTPAKTKVLFDNWLVQGGSNTNVALRWNALDLSGIAGYRFGWDQNPHTVPTQNQSDDHITITGKSGLWFAHLQAKNGAGLWSDVVDYPVIVP